MFEEALKFATKAHRNQKRRYTGEPYIVHPIAVSELVRTVSHTEEMLAAAVLHDVVEDTEHTLEEIRENFGEEVANLVFFLTDVSRPEDGNRATRKEMDALHYAKGPSESQTIKVADLIDNTKNISTLDNKFWEVYKIEKMRSLDLLTDADPELLEVAREQLLKNW